MILKYFKTSISITVFGLFLVSGIVWFKTNSITLVAEAVLTTFLLAILEVSLSFDNAVVNATIMKKMSDLWKKRFLTWGMLIAVFGMRILFPLLIVSVIGKINPIDAFKLSIYEPTKYADIMSSSHIYVASFGGMFLFLVFLHFFMNKEKDTHWIKIIEKPLLKSSEFKGFEIILTLVVLVFFSEILPQEKDHLGFIISGLFGIITFLLVSGVSSFLESEGELDESKQSIGANGELIAKTGLATFLYLEVLDASFSFDGVIGAFAITNSLFIIMIGLGIGAFFVRSLTIYFVEKNTIDNFIYLEHGAFYALGLLSIMMLLGSFVHIPEWIIGLSGLFILVLSVVFSITHKQKK